MSVVSFAAVSGCLLKHQLLKDSLTFFGTRSKKQDLVMAQDKDIDSPEVAALAAQAADLLTRAHAAAVEDAANSQGDITSGEPHTPASSKLTSPVV